MRPYPARQLGNTGREVQPVTSFHWRARSGRARRCRKRSFPPRFYVLDTETPRRLHRHPSDCSLSSSQVLPPVSVDRPQRRLSARRVMFVFNHQSAISQGHALRQTTTVDTLARFTDSIDSSRSPLSRMNSIRARFQFTPVNFDATRPRTLLAGVLDSPGWSK